MKLTGLLAVLVHDGSFVKLKGNAAVRRGDTVVSADSITYNTATKSLEASEHVTVRFEAEKRSN
jgi:lipopolysaccharide export system protein LptA